MQEASKFCRETTNNKNLFPNKKHEAFKGAVVNMTYTTLCNGGSYETLCKVREHCLEKKLKSCIFMHFHATT